MLFRSGKPHCPKCGREIKPQSAQQIIEEILKIPSGTKIQIMAPLIQGRTGTYQELFARLRQSGFVRVRVNGQILGLEEEIKLDRYKKQKIDLVVDRIVMGADIRERLADSIETALRESRGLVLVNRPDGDHLYSEHHACTHCGTSLPEIEPRMFSFNSPYGARPDCDGLGTKLEVDPDLVVPRPRSFDPGGRAPGLVGSCDDADQPLEAVLGRLLRRDPGRCLPPGEDPHPKALEGVVKGSAKDDSLRRRTVAGALGQE